MAKILRQPPSVSENKDPRAREYFENAVHTMLKLIGTRTIDVPSIASGGRQSFTITVKGAKPDQNQTVQVALPSTFNTALVPWGFVSAADTVTVTLYNPTVGAIDPPNAVYAARVMP